MSAFGHIDLRVSDVAAALAFYDELLPALGFTERYHGEDWKVWATTEPLPSTAYVAITEEKGHVANGNRIAFWVESAADVDRVTEIAGCAGAGELSGPKSMPYGPGYYASFFADPSGNRLGVHPPRVILRDMDWPSPLTVRDVAVELRCSEEDVRALIHSGELETVACGVRHSLVPRHRLDDYLRRQRRQLDDPAASATRGAGT